MSRHAFNATRYDDNRGHRATSVEFKNIRVRYLRNPEWVLNGVDLTMPPGQVTALLGRSGVGKTSLLRVAAGFLTLHASDNRRRWLDRLFAVGADEAEARGNLCFDGMSVSRVRPQDRHVAMVSQNWDLLPHLTVRRTLLLPLRLRGVDLTTANNTISRVLEQIGLIDKAERLCRRLSGGEMQRVTLGRLLVTPYPRLWLFDECLGSLDGPLYREFLELFRAILRQRPVTSLWVTHLPEEARAISHRIAVLGLGRVLQEGAFEEVERNPNWLEVFKLMTGLTADYTARLNPKQELPYRLGDGPALVRAPDASEPVVLAVQPSGWRLEARGGFTASVKDCIPTGSKVYELIVQVEKLCVARVRTNCPASIGDQVQVALDPNAVLWFSAADGRRLT